MALHSSPPSKPQGQGTSLLLKLDPKKAEPGQSGSGVSFIAAKIMLLKINEDVHAKYHLANVDTLTFSGLKGKKA